MKRLKTVGVLFVDEVNNGVPEYPKHTKAI